MKNVILFALLLFSTLNFAQNSYAVKIGAQTTGINNAIKGDNQNGFGAYVGVSTDFKLDDKFSFQPEILYSYQTFNNVNINLHELTGAPLYDNNYPRFDENYKVHFIKLPLLLKYQPKKLYFEFGGEVGYNLSSKLKFEDHLNEYPTYSGKLDHVNKIQFAALLGSGYQIDEKLGIGLRVGWGLTKFIENYYIKNFNVSAGISYKIK